MRLREDVYARAQGQCEYGCAHNGRCLSGLHGDWDLHPIDPGGPFTIDNLLALCEACARHARGSALGPLPEF